MRVALCLLCLLVVLTVLPVRAGAQGESPHTLESIQANFRYTVSPREALLYVRDAALWLSAQGEAGLKEFGNPHTKWNNLDGEHLQLQVWSVELSGIIRHPNPKLHHLVGVPQLANQHKDHSGRLAALEMMNTMANHPEGAWSATKTTYIRSVTGVSEPGWQLNVGVKVPNYPWYVVTHLPYQVETYEEAQQAVDDLNGLVKTYLSDAPLPAPEYTKEAILKHFRYTTSPKAAFDHLQQAALWLAEQGEAGLDEFSKPYSKWNHMDASTIQVQLWKSDECMVFRHPNTQLQHLVGVPNLGHRFKDHSGKLVALEQCTKLLDNRKGAFTATYTTYIMGVTGVQEPMYELNLGVGVPGYPWEVIAHMPYQADSYEEMQRVVEELNTMVDDWSIIEQ